MQEIFFGLVGRREIYFFDLVGRREIYFWLVGRREGRRENVVWVWQDDFDSNLRREVCCGHRWHYWCYCGHLWYLICCCGVLKCEGHIK